jgi:hypothetical protein
MDLIPSIVDEYSIQGKSSLVSIGSEVDLLLFSFSLGAKTIIKEHLINRIISYITKINLH